MAVRHTYAEIWRSDMFAIRSQLFIFKYTISDFKSDTIVSDSCFKLLFKGTLQRRQGGWVEKLAASSLLWNTGKRPKKLLVHVTT